MNAPLAAESDAASDAAQPGPSPTDPAAGLPGLMVPAGAGLMIGGMRRRAALAVVLLALATGLSGCGWRGVNSLPLPGTEGGGPGAYTVQAQLPQVTNLERNSRVRVGDVTVGNVSNIERQGWHALVTMTLNGNVDLPANATVKIGQTSLLGTLHIELAPPVHEEPEGKLQNGSLIPLENDASYPTTEQTLAAVSMLFNGGGLGQVHDITQAFSTAFKGREQDMRSFLEQLNIFVGELDVQKDDIIAATDSLNAVAGQFAAQKPVVDKALQTIPDALAVLSDEREDLTEALSPSSASSASLAADAVNRSKENVVKELDDVGPVLKSLADAGPSMTRSLSYLSTYPFPKETIENWVRGDYVNLTGSST